MSNMGSYQKHFCHLNILMIMIICLYQWCGWRLTVVICRQALGEQPVGEFAKRHIYEQYQARKAVSQQWRPFFLILIMQAMYRDDEQGKRKTYRDNCNSYNIATIRHIHQSHKVYYCFKIISIAKVRLFSHQSDKLYDVSTQFISSQPN